MANVVVVGAQWGDEGKGKIVDWLSERADVVVRFQGGHNAGHTLVIDGEVFKLSLLPSGVVRSDKLSMIGNGVVIDPWALLEEIDRIVGQGVNSDIENDADYQDADLYEVDKNEWECSACTAKNREANEVCVVCDSSGQRDGCACCSALGGSGDGSD